MKNVILLHRKGQKTWVFKRENSYNRYLYTTRSNVYKIVFTVGADRPFFIAKMEGSYVYKDVTNELRSYALEFQGGCYYFN